MNPAKKDLRLLIAAVILILLIYSWPDIKQGFLQGFQDAQQIKFN